MGLTKDKVEGYGRITCRYLNSGFTITGPSLQIFTIFYWVPINKIHIQWFGQSEVLKIMAHLFPNCSTSISL